MPTQTPGPRRFAPPASSSSVRNTALSAASVRFARPSQPTSSPFTRTPFSSTTRKDEIEGDDDEDDFEEEAHSAGLRQQSIPARANNRPKGNGNDVDLNESIRIRSDPEPGHITRDFETRPSSRGPKRRKISHLRPGDLRSPSDLLGSSPEDGSLVQESDASGDEHEESITRSRQPSPTDSQADQLASENEREMPEMVRGSSPSHTEEESPSKEFATPKMRTSRFRNPLTQSSQLSINRQNATAASEIPLPSFQSRLLAASTPTSPGPHLRGPHPSLDYVLPDAFSPSRKRGQHEYIEHGHAEVVRSWVLDIAARSGVNDDQHSLGRSAFTEANTFTVAEVIHRDVDDRFALLSTADEDYRWMLVDTDSRPQLPTVTGNTPKSRVERLHEGSRFVLRGGQVSNWMLGSKEGLTSIEDGQSSSVAHRVVVLWDLIH